MKRHDGDKGAALYVDSGSATSAPISEDVLGDNGPQHTPHLQIPPQKVNRKDAIELNGMTEQPQAHSKLHRSVRGADKPQLPFEIGFRISMPAACGGELCQKRTSGGCVKEEIRL